ncbi:MAG: hypothetical protein LBK12_06225 [Odoribacteraceae bacterium]|jgi:hypothetical protein|nr:hypothetical protein [Odoribacteraceae bacterium]
MKKNLSLLGIAAGALLQACYEDKGNYDYIPANEVIITMPAASVNANMGDTLYYTPAIAFANPADTTGFEYWWEYTGDGTLDHHEVICEGRELRFMPRLVGQQYVQLCVKEPRTSTITTASMGIYGGSLYTKGWLILREENGESKLSFVRPDRLVPGDATSERRYVPDVDLYGRLFPGESLGGGPVALRQAFSYLGTLSIFYVLQERDPACLNGVSYAKEILLAREFVGDAPAGFSPRDYYQGNYSCMVLDAGGNAYHRCPPSGPYTNFFVYSFANFPVEYQGRPLKIDRIVPSLAEKVYFYAVLDKENGRLLWVRAGNANNSGGMLPSAITADGEYLDYNDTGDAEILHSAFYNEESSSGVTYYLTLYTKNGNARVQRCRVTGGSIISTAIALPVNEVQNAVFPAQPALSPATKYHQLKTRPYLFFSTGNRLYWYDHTGTYRLFYTFPPGEEIVDMDANPQESELGVVSSGGKFVTLNIENEYLMGNDNKIYEITLPGRIVDLEYKFPNYNTYLNRTSTANWD